MSSPRHLLTIVVSSIGITLHTYSHVMPGMREEAAERIDAGLCAALAG